MGGALKTPRGWRAACSAPAPQRQATARQQGVSGTAKCASRRAAPPPAPRLPHCQSTHLQLHAAGGRRAALLRERGAAADAGRGGRRVLRAVGGAQRRARARRQQGLGEVGERGGGDGAGALVGLQAPGRAARACGGGRSLEGVGKTPCRKRKTGSNRLRQRRELERDCGGFRGTTRGRQAGKVPELCCGRAPAASVSPRPGASSALSTLASPVTAGWGRGHVV